MTDKKRKVSERSLENLKLGAESRRVGKVRHNFTILPETVQWLKGTGNASDTIDALVASFKTGELDSNHTHNEKDNNQLVSDSVYERIKELETENEQLRSQLAKQKEAVSLLEKAITSVKQGGLYQSNSAKPVKEAVEKALGFLLDQETV
jgi:hypothetical protein